MLQKNERVLTAAAAAAAAAATLIMAERCLAGGSHEDVHQREVRPVRLAGPGIEWTPVLHADDVPEEEIACEKHLEFVISCSK